MTTNQLSAQVRSLLTAAEEALLVSVVKAMYPHPGLSDGPYERVVALVLGEASHIPRLAHAVRDLVTTVMAEDGISDELELAGALEAIGSTACFEAVRSRVCHHLYADREVWVRMGYPGASFAEGGYLHRGFNDLAWLPEPRIEESGEEMVEVVDATVAMEKEGRA